MYRELFKQYKRIVVTGGSGFIGGNLISKILKETDCEIFNIDKMGYASDQTIILKSFALSFGISPSLIESSTPLAIAPWTVPIKIFV